MNKNFLEELIINLIKYLLTYHAREPKAATMILLYTILSVHVSLESRNPNIAVKIFIIDYFCYVLIYFCNFTEDFVRKALFTQYFLILEVKSFVKSENSKVNCSSINLFHPFSFSGVDFINSHAVRKD